jgi:NitT/TauT family transport system ATP-binding protein
MSLTNTPPSGVRPDDVAGDAPPLAPPVLGVHGITKRYGPGLQPVLEDLTFEVQAGEIVCIVGPSGIGKTTLLKSIAGLHAVSSGRVEIDGVPISGPPRQMALVFQDYSRSLMPWLTVPKNVEMPLRRLKLGKKETEERRRAALEAVNLVDAERKYPWQLSGGMQQRVAIARALAYQPEVLIMDEPFASVDAQTRFDLEDLTLSIRDNYGMTIVVVTHDIDEAVYLADRVIVLGGQPARVRTTIEVDLPSPRTQVTTRADHRFASLRTEVFEVISRARPDASLKP